MRALFVRMIKSARNHYLLLYVFAICIIACELNMYESQIDIVCTFGLTSLSEWVTLMHYIIRIELYNDTFRDSFEMTFPWKLIQM